MGVGCLISIKESFQELNLIYNSVITKVNGSSQFNNQEVLEEFYKSAVEYFIKLESIITNKYIKFSFFDEVEYNIQNNDYLDRLELYFERQFKFLSKFEESIHVYFNEKKSRILVLEDLNVKFHNVRIPENRSYFLTRNEKDMKEITAYIKDNFEVEDDLIPEMIYEQDLRLYELYGDTPYEYNFSNQHKRKFIHAIQLYYVDLFFRLENIIHDAYPKYNRKLNNIDSLEDDKFNYIRLKHKFRNDQFKLNLYNFLIKHDYLNCEFIDFESLFYPSEIIVNWRGIEKELMQLFKGTPNYSITEKEIDISKIIENRFTCKGTQLKFRQLRTAHCQAKSKGVIYSFLEKCNN